MRSVLLVLLLLAPACSFPVDDFVVTDGGDGGTPSDARSTPSDSSSATVDARPCTCVEYDDKDKTKCKKWLPDHCGEEPKG